MAKLYGSRGTKATQLSKVYLPMDGKAKQINKIYGSVNGQTRLIFNHFTAPPLIEILTYMQDCANYSLTQLKEGMVEEKPYTLIDKRDNTEYTIALLKDGNIWMCENLRIGSNDERLSISSADTDCGAHKPYTILLPQGSTTGFSDNNAENLYIDPTYGGYYTWKCATLGGWDDVLSILPNGWKLPKSTEIIELTNAYGGDNATGSLALRSEPFNFTLAGNYNNSKHANAGYGYMWSATVVTSDLAGFLSVGPKRAYYCEINGDKRNGFVVRGICKGNGVD